MNFPIHYNYKKDCTECHICNKEQPTKHNPTPVFDYSDGKTKIWLMPNFLKKEILKQTNGKNLRNKEIIVTRDGFKYDVKIVNKNVWEIIKNFIYELFLSVKVKWIIKKG